MARTLRPVAGKALIDPQQVANHRLLVIRRRQTNGAPEFSIPGVDHLVRQQIPRFGGEGRAHHAEFGHLIIAGLRMLQSIAAVGLRFHQEVITRIVVGVEQGSGFGDKVAVSGDSLRRNIESLGRFLKQVQQMALRNSLRRDVKLAHDRSAHQRRIDQRSERYRVEMNRGTLQRGIGQRGRVRPSFRKLDRGCNGDLVGRWCPPDIGPLGPSSHRLEPESTCYPGQNRFPPHTLPPG